MPENEKNRFEMKNRWESHWKENREIACKNNKINSKQTVLRLLII